jgi:hypothetical protein
MSVTRRSRPFSPQTIIARIFVAVIGIALFVVVFILPWLVD